MPPLPSVPNVIKAIIQGNSGESTEIPWANILHFAFTGASPTEAVIAAICSAIATQWGTHMSPEQVNNVTQNEVAAFDLTSPTAASAADFTVNPGTRGDDEIPAQTAYLVDYPIARRYRGGHPRNYLMVGGNADFLDAAHWSTAFTAEALSHWNAFLTAIIGVAHSGTTLTGLVNVSYISKEENPVPPYRRTVPVVDTISLSTMVGEQQMASQRRRIGRHRR
jgi:hypothetical protein